MKVEMFLRQVPLFLFALIFVLLSALKVGIRWPQVVVWSNEYGLLPESSPEPLSYGFRLVGAVLQFDSASHYLALSTVVSIAAVVATVTVIYLRLGSGLNGRIATLLLVSGPIVWTLASNVGPVDSLLILGSVLLVGPRKLSPTVVVGVGFMILANPEQAVVALSSLLVLSFNSDFVYLRARAILALFLCGCAVLLLIVWSERINVGAAGGQSRLDLLPILAGQSLGRFFIYLPLQFWAGLGMAGLLILWTVASKPGWRNRLCLVGGSILVPGLATALTLDQSRVFICTSAAAVVAIVLRYADALSDRLERMTTHPLAMVALAALVLPAVHIDFAGQVVPPWLNIYEYLSVRLTAWTAS